MPSDAAAVGEEQVLEVWSMLGAVAAATDRLRIGSLVCSVTYRHPVMLTAAALTCDQISGGRVVLGVGAGWQRSEHRGLGLERGSPKSRSDRLEEACSIIRSLLDVGHVSFEGSYVSAHDVTLRPRPADETLPLLVAGKGARRTLQTAALFADEWNGWVTARELSRCRSTLAAHCERIDRDPSEISLSTQAFLCLDASEAEAKAISDRFGGRPVLWGGTDRVTSQVAELEAAGADELIVADWNFDVPAERDEALARFIEMGCGTARG